MEKRILDPWQRLDDWNGNDKKHYKPDLIKTILHGNYIPGIVEYTLKGDTTAKRRILDGGHRTRTIDEFMDGRFPVKLSTENYYWWNKDDSRPARVGGGRDLILPNELKDIFKNYKVSVTTYLNLTDEQARGMFNDLNHCSPMKVHEVINSHSSLLIDNLRELWGDIVLNREEERVILNKTIDILKQLKEEGTLTGEQGEELFNAHDKVKDIKKISDEYANIRKIFGIPKKDLESLKYMKVLISLFSLVAERR